MTQGIFVSTTSTGAGKSLVSLGLADSLYKRSGTVGYYRPIVPGDDVEADPMVLLLRELYGLSPEQARGGLTAAEARALMAEGRADEVQERCVEHFDAMAQACGVVVVEGTDLNSPDPAVDLELNAQLARNLGTPVIAVTSGAGVTPAQAADAVDLARRSLDDAGVDLLAVLVNRAEAEGAEAIRAAVRPGRHSWPVYVIPELPELAHPSVAEVAAELGLEQVAGAQSLDRDVAQVKAVSMEGGNFLEVLEEGALVIVSGDRSDAILATLASALTPDFPTPSGMILTNGILPNRQLQRLYLDAPFPVLVTHEDTFTTATRVSRVRTELSSAQPRKTAAALGAWHQRVDGDELLERIDLPRTSAVTPLRFLHELIERARADRRRIVLPEGEDARVLRAAEIKRERAGEFPLGPDDESSRAALDRKVRGSTSPVGGRMGRA